VLLFDERELRRLILDAHDWELVSELDLVLSDEARASAVAFGDAAAHVEAGLPGRASYPHIVLREGEHVWTSVHLAVRK